MPASFLHKERGFYEHHCAPPPNNYIATQSKAVQVNGGRERDKGKQPSMKLMVVRSIFLKKNTLCNVHFCCGRRKIIKYHLENLYYMHELVFFCKKKSPLTKDRWPEAHPESPSPCIFFQSHNSTLDRQSPVARHLLGM